VWLSWTLIGLAYPLYNVFLPVYLKTRGASFGGGSNYETWRNYALVNVAGIGGPLLAGVMCNSRFFQRRGTMVIGALATMVFFFACAALFPSTLRIHSRAHRYTQVRTQAQNLGFSCAINFALNIYYGTLYAYTPEVLPSAHRATGNGVAVACNRVMGIVSAVVATYADTARRSTSSWPASRSRCRTNRSGGARCKRGAGTCACTSRRKGGRGGAYPIPTSPGREKDMVEERLCSSASVFSFCCSQQGEVHVYHLYETHPLT
jgi:hypothetical protein